MGKDFQSGYGATMPKPDSDAAVVDVLRRVDRLTAPLVRRLGRPPALPQAERDDWWAERVSRVVAGGSALPRLAGKLADLLPLQNTVGATAQALVVLGVAGEHRVTDPAERVALLGRVLLDRQLPVERVRALLDSGGGRYVAAALGERDERAGVTGSARTVWRAARLLSRIDDALDARPKGRLGARAVANLPVVGVLGGYAAERVALRRAARRTVQLIGSAGAVTTFE